ncbi:predicted protein [Naegleria gruberi]|uniref:Predicted protein n=1 Tax=Naegleria gruberi TaxID=5762 RepID=D2W4W4_NAEGR|nr:uncharacterized protein NAEGRDRAFT_76452 [Naegleria gruberi]EFC35886.1 predicted protein [Naegleria gruberi]|eukprot:XP_002668630.1 predicted protein [Naegleria gruberi strain NEG-M]
MVQSVNILFHVNRNVVCENGGNCTFSKGVEVCSCPPGFAGKTCDPACSSNKNCTDQYFPICDVSGVCTYECLSDGDCATVVGRPMCETGRNEFDIGGKCIAGCINDTSCIAKGMQYCNDGVCSNYACAADADCVSRGYSQCADFECRDECHVNSDCSDFGKYSICGADPSNNSTYHRCIPRSCFNNSDCADPMTGTPRCDLSTYLCAKADCSIDSDCYSYGYSLCSNSFCKIECLSHTDCNKPGLQRCGLNNTVPTEYRRCLESCDSTCEKCSENRITCLQCSTGFVVDNLGKCVIDSTNPVNNSTNPQNNTNPVDPVNPTNDTNPIKILLPQVVIIPLQVIIP